LLYIACELRLVQHKTQKQALVFSSTITQLESLKPSLYLWEQIVFLHHKMFKKPPSDD